jgi:predicted transposase YbfD/YdcC
VLLGHFGGEYRSGIAQGADYLTTLKANQKTLYNDAAALFDQREAARELPETSDLQVYKEVDGGHDRVEIRCCQAVDLEGRELSSAEGWPGLKTLCNVEAERHHPDGTVEKEERLFITSLEADPKELLKTVRSHWHAENKLHWRLDVAFQEDASRVRKGHAAQNLGGVRRLALTLLKQETSRSGGTKTKRMEAGWNPDDLLKVLTGH